MILQLKKNFSSLHHPKQFLLYSFTLGGTHDSVFICTLAKPISWLKLSIAKKSSCVYYFPDIYICLLHRRFIEFNSSPRKLLELHIFMKTGWSDILSGQIISYQSFKKVGFLRKRYFVASKLPLLKILLAPQAILDSIEVSIPACHAGDPGSIPGRGVNYFLPYSHNLDEIFITLTIFNQYTRDNVFEFNQIVITLVTWFYIVT